MRQESCDLPIRCWDLANEDVGDILLPETAFEDPRSRTPIVRVFGRAEVVFRLGLF